MLRTTMKVSVFLVGGHLLLWLTAMITDAVHGINDQDLSFVLALLIRFLNMPAIRLLESLGVGWSVIPLILIGVLQWTLISFAIAAVYTMVSSRSHASRGNADKTKPKS